MKMGAKLRTLPVSQSQLSKESASFSFAHSTATQNAMRGNFREINSDFSLKDAWKTCQKIREAACRKGLNLWDYFRPLDPNNDYLIPETDFIIILVEELKEAIQLSSREIQEVTDHFRALDGRIIYTRFCEVVHDTVPEFDKEKICLSCAEEPYRVNALTPTELRKLNIILTQIAATIYERRICLRPYFEDYDSIAENAGSVSFAHFGRILTFLNITVAPLEFVLLIKRFAKDAFTINYEAFLSATQEVQTYLEKCGLLTPGSKLLEQLRSGIITAELPKLVRPEVGKVLPSQVFGKQTVFHPAMEPKGQDMCLEEIVQRVQRHILEHRIRIREFFKDADPANIGKVSLSEFRRGLDGIQVSSLGRLYLPESQINALITLYQDPSDPDRVCWRKFEDEINCVFTVRGLEKLPNLRVEAPPDEIAGLPRKGARHWQCVDKSIRELCEETLRKIRQRVEERRLYLRQFFRNFDRLNRGHVTRSQMRQVLVTATILLSPEEEFALEQRYNNDQGFKYNLFLDELEATTTEEPLYNSMLVQKRLINGEKEEPTPTADETNILLILAKLKAKVVRDRVKVTEFMQQYDSLKKMYIKKCDFIRALDQLRCELTCAEVDTIMKVYQSRERPDCIEYMKFGDTVEEAVAKGYLECSPLLEPLQHVPSEACIKTFMNFEERVLLTEAMDKLSRVYQPNLDEIFKDFDKENIGTVPKNCLMRALSVRRMLELISCRELDVIHKCFSVERGRRLEIDYRVFLRALHYIQENRKKISF